MLRVRLGRFVARGVQAVEHGGQSPPLHVERFELIELALQGGVTPPGERGAHLLGRGAKQLEIDHVLLSGEAGREAAVAAILIDEYLHVQPALRGVHGEDAQLGV